MAHFRGWLRGWLRKEEPAPGPPLPRPRTRSSRPRSFAEDNNEFALALYGQLRQGPGNLFFSPFSIRAALAMAHAGARGETAAQMRAALYISSSEETLHDACAQTVSRLDAAGGEYEMAVASSLWAQHGAPLRPKFLDLIARQYGGSMNIVDFRRGTGTARATMNRWVENQTRQKIRELIPAGGLDADTRLVLVNAVYFKGMWVLPFPKAVTRDEPFDLEGGGRVRTPLMHVRAEVRYLAAKDYQAVELLYRGGDLSMLILLPNQKDGLRDLEKRDLVRVLHDCAATMFDMPVELFLPRFTINWGCVNVRGQLTALGMPLAFSRFLANFSGINEREPPHADSLFISDVFHKAIVEVNEDGTEAAAATAVSTAPASGRERSTPPVPIFRADHPFLFAIRDGKTGAILFLGRMADPTRQ